MVSEDALDVYWETVIHELDKGRRKRMQSTADLMTFEARLDNLREAHENGHPDSRRFYEILVSLAELHDRKQKDYGRDSDPFANVRRAHNLGVKPSLGVVLRMGDKFGRLESFAIRGSLANEPVEDSLRDLAVYAIIGLVLLGNGE